jgi:glycosyltransferase involved in cell wall biosynthesis
LLAFSIITPTLNAERFLADCLRSVRAQGVPNLEHLIVDGGSTDRTREIVENSGATWLSRPGLRQAAAINAGLRVARGEVVAWLNADDFYKPDALTYVAREFISGPGVDVVVGDCEVIDTHGERLRLVSPGPYDFHRLLRTGNSIAQPAVFLRKRVFDQVGLLDETLEFGMDYDLWLRLRGLRVEYVSRVLAQFRWHCRSKTANNVGGNWQELIEIVRRYGGGWTPRLIWLYVRAHLTLARQQVSRRCRGE